MSSPRATRARSGRTLVRDPASRARARRRPSAFDARRAKNDDADARERMTFENARGCGAYRRSRDRRARVHACAPFASGVGRTLGSRNRRGGRTHGAPPANADRSARRAKSSASSLRFGKFFCKRGQLVCGARAPRERRAGTIRVMYLGNFFYEGRLTTISLTCSARTRAARSPSRRSTPGPPTIPSPGTCGSSPHSSPGPPPPRTRARCRTR